MSNRILILFAHPRFEMSANNALLVKNIPAIPEITFHDLYENYPDFNIDVEREKKLLSDHQIIIWHHPFYWYSSPPLLKQWIDLVLAFGWAYGPGGDALEGKIIFNCITLGGPQAAYNREGHNRFTVTELLAPFHQTAHLCKMKYLPPFAMHGTHKLADQEKTIIAGHFGIMLKKFVSGDFSSSEIEACEYMNDWVVNQTVNISPK